MTTEAKTPNSTMRLVVIGALVIGAFFGAYRIASAVSGRSSGNTGTTGIAAGAPTGSPGAGASGSDTPACACCGSAQPTENGVSGTEAAGTATVEGDVQKIAVDLSTGTYAPNVLKLKAGVPTEITFGQSSGCTAVVQSKDLGFQEDLTAGPKTVKLGALEPGTYAFSCGMEMVFGKIVVE